MSIMRALILQASRNQWLRTQAPRYQFLRSAVSRFMPGEHLEDALGAACELHQQGIGCVLNELGENVTEGAAAERQADRYIEATRRSFQFGLTAEVSVKLTHLGLDIDPGLCLSNLSRVVESAAPGTVVWIDMEDSRYTDVTLDLCCRMRERSERVGVCLQACLYRTGRDLEDLLPLGVAVRLVKGAYRESSRRAFSRKCDVDENYYRLSRRLLSDDAQRRGVRAAIATHDAALIGRIVAYANLRGLAKTDYEFQMLYGIKHQEQRRLAKEGFRSIVFICYGVDWWSWYMRRLAERPANLWFVAKSLVN